MENQNVCVLFQLALQIACSARACTLEEEKNGPINLMPDRERAKSQRNKRQTHCSIWLAPEHIHNRTCDRS